MVNIATVTYLTPANAWPSIPQLEDGWWPTGGVVNAALDQGLMNWQALHLTARTGYLRNLLQVAGLDPTNYPNEANLNAIAGTGFFRFLSTAANAPTPGSGYDAAGMQIAAAGQVLQIVSLSYARPLLYRIKDDTTWGAWYAIVDERRTIAVAGLATGGGDLSADRTITVPVATLSEAQDGTSNTVAMTPLRTMQMVAGLAFGAVGSYAFAQYSGADVDHGATVAGSTLQASNAAAGGLSAALSGTWRAMGNPYTTNITERTTLWLRIA